MIINSKCQYYFVFDITRWILEEIIEVEHAMLDYYCSLGNNMTLCFKSCCIGIIINISLFNGGMSNKEFRKPAEIACKGHNLSQALDFKLFIHGIIITCIIKGGNLANCLKF